MHRTYSAPGLRKHSTGAWYHHDVTSYASPMWLHEPLQRPVQSMLSAESGEECLEELAMDVQREDSLSLAHRRMSAHDSPHSRHSTGDISKGDHRRSRFHFAPADLLNTDAFHQVTGELQPLQSPGQQHLEASQCAGGSASGQAAHCRLASGAAFFPETCTSKDAHAMAPLRLSHSGPLDCTSSTVLGGSALQHLLLRAAAMVQ